MESRETLAQEMAPKMVVTIIDRDNAPRLEDILREKHVHFNYSFFGMGTASSEILKTFGLSGTEKTVCVCFEPAALAHSLMISVAERLELTHPGNGIVFLMPVSGADSNISNTLGKEFEQHRERWAQFMEAESLKKHEEARYELVMAIISQGHSEAVMHVARAHGVRGGTVVHARHAGVEDVVKFFGISVQAEKEIVAMLVHKGQKRELMQAICADCGTKAEVRGLVISLPVEACAGINMEDGEEP